MNDTKLTSIDPSVLASVIGGAGFPDPVFLSEKDSAFVYSSLPRMAPTGVSDRGERGMTFDNGDVLACDNNRRGVPRCSLTPASPQ